MLPVCVYGVFTQCCGQCICTCIHVCMYMYTDIAFAMEMCSWWVALKCSGTSDSCANFLQYAL